MQLPAAAHTPQPPVPRLARRGSRDEQDLSSPQPRSVWNSEVKIHWRRCFWLVALAAMGGSARPLLSHWGAHRHEAGLEEARRSRFAPPPPLNSEQQKAFENFGLSLAEAYRQNGAEALAAHLDVEDLSYRAIRDLKLGEPLMTLILNEASKSTHAPPPFILAGRKAHCALLRIRTADAFPSVLLRIHHEDGGILYIEVLAKPHSQGFRIVDIRLLTLDLWLSDLLRATSLTQLKHTPPGLAARAFGLDTEPSILDDLSVSTFVKAFLDKNAELMLLGLRDAPAALKESKLALVMQAITFRHSQPRPNFADSAVPDPDRLLQKLMVRPVQRLFWSGFDGTNRSTRMTRRELDEADAELGGDPYVKCLIASNELETGAPSSASNLLLQAVADDPSLLDMTAALRLRASAALADFPALHCELDRLTHSAPERLPSALAGLELSAFLASPEGRHWRDRLPPPIP